MPKKIKIAVVGTGLMGLQHIKAINKSKKASLHSFVDINKKLVNISIPGNFDFFNIINNKTEDIKFLN